MTSSTTVVADRFVHAAMIICVAMMSALLWMPSFFGVLHDSYGMAAGTLGNLAFAELGGFLFGTLFTSTKTIAQLKRWALLACAALVAVNVAMLLRESLPFIVMRPLAGFASGIGFGYVLKLCSASARPTRHFGILTALMSLMMIIGFQSVAYFVDRLGMKAGAVDIEGVKNVAKLIFGAYTTLAIVAAGVLLSNSPPQPDNQSDAPAKQHGIPPPMVMVGLLAILLSFAGQGSIWAFLQTLGISHGFTVGGVANAMSAFAIMGIVGSLVAAAVPHRLPRSLLIGGALLALFGGLYALYAPASLIWYIAGCAIGGFYWNFVLPLLLGILARIDPTGQGSVLGGTMSSAGSALGPLLAGTLIQGTNYQPVGWLAAGLCIAGLVCVILVENRIAPVAAASQAQ
jgi:MFS family permease